MSISFGTKQVDGFDKELLLYGEGYIGKPVTLNADSSASVVVTDKGRKIIPQGSYLYGSSDSLITNPQQVAVVVAPTVAKATITINSALVVTAKAEGVVAYEVELKVGTGRKTSISATESKATVTLGVDKEGAVNATYGDVVAVINEDITANTYVVASVADADKDTTAAAGDGTTAGGGKDTVASDIDGILLHSVDVTDGEAVGAMMIAGYVNMDNMPAVPGAAVIAKLPNIKFGRID